MGYLAESDLWPISLCFPPSARSSSLVPDLRALGLYPWTSLPPPAFSVFLCVFPSYSLPFLPWPPDLLL